MLYEENQRFFKAEVSSRSLECIDTIPKLGGRGSNKEATDGIALLWDIIYHRQLRNYGGGWKEETDGHSVTTNGRRTP
jgi:hypothetical protein